MNLKEIKELLDLVVEKGVTEFELERSGVRLKMKRETNVSASPAGTPMALHIERLPAAAPKGIAPPAPAEDEAPEEPVAPGESLHLIKSPIVGTFYASPKPDAPAFVKPGDSVEQGKVLCIIEAMKLMNEIESDVAGEIVKCYVASAQPVEYGETLFSLRPRRKK